MCYRTCCFPLFACSFGDTLLHPLHNYLSPLIPHAFLFALLAMVAISTCPPALVCCAYLSFFFCFAVHDICVSLHLLSLVAFCLCAVLVFFPQRYPHSIFVLFRHFLTNVSICIPQCIYRPLNMDTRCTFFIKSPCLSLSVCFAVILCLCFAVLMPNMCFDLHFCLLDRAVIIFCFFLTMEAGVSTAQLFPGFTTRWAT